MRQRLIALNKIVRIRFFIGRACPHVFDQISSLEAAKGQLIIELVEDVLQDFLLRAVTSIPDTV